MINPPAAKNCRCPLYALLALLVDQFAIPSARQSTDKPDAPAEQSAISLPLIAVSQHLQAGNRASFLLHNDAARCHLQSHAEHTRTLADAYFLVTYAAAGGRLSAALWLTGVLACGVAHFVTCSCSAQDVTTTCNLICRTRCNIRQK